LLLNGYNTRFKTKMTLDAIVSGGHGAGHAETEHHAHAADHGGGHKKKKKEAKHIETIDDFLAKFDKEHSKDLGDAVEKHRAVRKEEYQNAYFNNLFTPAQHDLYNTVSTQLDEAIGEDNEKLNGKKPELQKAIAEGLKAYFKKVRPSVTKALEGHKFDKPDDEYAFLVGMYDNHIGAKDGEGLSDIVDAYSTNKKATVGGLKRLLHTTQVKHQEGALNKMLNQHLTQYLGKYDPIGFAQHIRPKLEEAGYEVEDKIKFATLNAVQFYNVMEGLESGNFGKDGPGIYGLKKKEKEHKGDHGHGGHEADAQ